MGFHDKASTSQKNVRCSVLSVAWLCGIFLGGTPDQKYTKRLCECYNRMFLKYKNVTRHSSPRFIHYALVFLYNCRKFLWNGQKTKGYVSVCEWKVKTNVE